MMKAESAEPHVSTPVSIKVHDSWIRVTSWNRNIAVTKFGNFPSTSIQRVRVGKDRCSYLCPPFAGVIPTQEQVNSYLMSFSVQWLENTNEVSSCLRKRWRRACRSGAAVRPQGYSIAFVKSDSDLIALAKGKPIPVEIPSDINSVVSEPKSEEPVESVSTESQAQSTPQFPPPETGDFLLGRVTALCKTDETMLVLLKALDATERRREKITAMLNFRLSCKYEMPNLPTSCWNKVSKAVTYPLTCLGTFYGFARDAAKFVSNMLGISVMQLFFEFLPIAPPQQSRDLQIMHAMMIERGDDIPPKPKDTVVAERKAAGNPVVFPNPARP